MYLVIDKTTRELFAIELTDPENSYTNHHIVEVDSTSGLKLRRFPRLDMITNIINPGEPGTIFTIQDLLELKRRVFKRRRVRFLRDTASLLDADSPLTANQKAGLRSLRLEVFNLDLTDPDNLTFPDLPQALKDYLGE